MQAWESLRPLLAWLSVCVGLASFGCSATPERPDAPSEVVTVAVLPPEQPVISEVVLHRYNVFSDQEEAFVYRAVNKVHVITRPRVIRRELLLQEGDRYDPELAEESERVLRALSFIADARVYTRPNPDGSVALHVETWDRFTLRAGGSLGFFGGDSSSRVSLGETNLFGSGKSAKFKNKTNSDNRSASVSYDDPQFLGTHHRLGVTAEDTDEGGNLGLSLTHPFRTLETRYSYGIELERSRSEVDFFVEGESVVDVPRRSDGVSLFLQGAEGPREFRRKTGVRFSYFSEEYRHAEGVLAGTVEVPPDAHIIEIGPTFALDYVRRFAKRRQLDSILRPEDVPIGLRLDGFVGLQHRDERSNGTDRNELVLSARARVAGELGENQLITLELVGRQRLDGGETRGWNGKAGLHYYYQGLPSQTLAASIVFDGVREKDGLARQLTLGEDSGLRGYKARLFAGDRRLRINLEDRIFTPLQVLSLRIGAVVFFDSGMAWYHGDGVSFSDLYHSIGVGLRAGNPALLRNVARFDLAFPLNNADGNNNSVSFSASIGQIFSVFGNSEELDDEF